MTQFFRILKLGPASAGCFQHTTELERRQSSSNSIPISKAYFPARSITYQSASLVTYAAHVYKLNSHILQLEYQDSRYGKVSFLIVTCLNSVVVHTRVEHHDGLTVSPSLAHIQAFRVSCFIAVLIQHSVQISYG